MIMIRLLYILRPQKKLILWTMVLLFLQTLGSLYIPTLTANIINIGVAERNIPYILRTGGLMAGTAVGAGICAVLAAYQSSRIASYAGRALRISLFTKAQNLSASEFETIGTSSMITRSTGDIIQLQQAVLFTFQFLLPVPLMAVSGLILGFAKDPVLSALLIVLMGIFVIYGVLIGKSMIPITRSMQRKMDLINGTLLERLSGVRVIRAFNREAYEKEKFTGVASGYADTAISLNKVYAVTYGFIMLTMNMIAVLFLWLGGVRISAGYTKIGDIMAFIEYAALILLTLNMGIMTVIFMFRAQACADRVWEVLHIQPDTAADPAGVDWIEPCQGLEFKDVTFGYDGAEEPVLRNISFTARAGETTAIIGGTGSGKSTIMKLIPGFHRINEGEILFSGHRLSSLSLKSLRSRIGLVPQKAFLFSGTIEENLRYGNTAATYEDICHGAKIAQAHEFIEALPGGYRYPITQEGGNLSGGQKQRLAIARAIVKKPDIYLFDDSFSALDYQTDARLRSALQKEVADSVVIIVSQIIRSIQNADQIIVLDEGRIAGTGSHRELLKSCPVYRQIAASQLSGEEMEG